MKPLTPIECLGIKAAQHSVRRIADEVPACLEGEELVGALVALLSAAHGAVWREHGNVSIAAAAIAALVENERAQARGERSVIA